MLKTVFCLESNFFNIVFNVSFDQCNVPLLNKSIDFFQQQKKIALTLTFWTVMWCVSMICVWYVWFGICNIWPKRIEWNPNKTMLFHYTRWRCSTTYLLLGDVCFSLEFSVAPHCRTQDPGGGAWSTSRGWRLVGLGAEMGGFRDQGVETGRFRYM